MKLIKPEEAIHILNIGRSEFYKLAKRSDFPALKIGRCLYVEQDRLNEWITMQIEKYKDKKEGMLQHEQSAAI